MSVATHQPSPPSPHPLPPSTPRFQNFRPLRYQTTEELDRFFGTTLAQRREQRLRVRDSNGQIYFDWIEKDEWQHLLATGSLTSPSSPSGEAEAGGRRSSGWTCMTLESPLCEAAWSGRRASSVGEASPLTARFDRVRIGEGEERRGRKRSSSVLAAGRRVDDCVALNNNAEDSWIKTRRQSDEYPYSPRSFCAVSNDDRIRISRLPLRKLDQQSLDQAFGSTTRKPSTLHIPDIIQSVELDDETTHDSSWTASPMVTLDSTSARRGTFGSLFPPAPIPPQQAVGRRMRHSSADTPPLSAMEFLASPTPTSTFASSQAGRLRHATSFETPKTPSFHHHTTTTHSFTNSSGQWNQRQRWHSAETPIAPTHPQQPLRSVRSVTSLRETSSLDFSSSFSTQTTTTTTTTTTTAAVRKDAMGENRTRRTSTSSGGSSSASETCYTPLAPRVGAKKYDKSRKLLVDSSAASPIRGLVEVVSMRDPLSTTSSSTSTTTTHNNTIVASEATTQAEEKVRTAVGLRTGPEVYLGIDIPCASIHLHSDPEDNVEPALALSLSASRLKKLKKKAHSNVAAEGEGEGGSAGHARASSVGQGLQKGQFAKGSSRWWSHILHG